MAPKNEGQALRDGPAPNKRKPAMTFSTNSLTVEISADDMSPLQGAIVSLNGA